MGSIRSTLNGLVVIKLGTDLKVPLMNHLLVNITDESLLTGTSTFTAPPTSPSNYNTNNSCFSCDTLYLFNFVFIEVIFLLCSTLILALRSTVLDFKTCI